MKDDGSTPNYQNGQFCRTAFTLKSGAAGVFTLSSVLSEGQPLGDAREITVKLSALQTPLAGRELEIQNADPARHYSIRSCLKNTARGLLTNGAAFARKKMGAF